VEPNFDFMMAGAVIFALAVLSYIWWRFGGPDALAFAVVSGLFTASMDFISAFVAQNYEYLASRNYGCLHSSCLVGSACAVVVCLSPKGS
jgi:hypothetical protein